MLTKLIRNFMSRGEARTFIEYSVANGTSAIEERPDGIDSTEGLAAVLGSIVSSAKLFHISKYYDKRLKLASCQLSSGSRKPELPGSALVVSIFYLSKQPVVDKTNDSSVESEVGSMIALAADEYESLVLGESSEEVYRFFSFWEAE